MGSLTRSYSSHSWSPNSVSPWWTRHDLPAVAVVAAVAPHLVVLLGVDRRCVGVLDRRGDAGTGQRLERHAVALGGGLDPTQLHERRVEVGHVRVLPSHRAGVADAVGPGDDERHLVTAGVGVDLVEAERRVARHRPTPGVVGDRLRAADQIEAVVVGLPLGFAQQVGEVAGGAPFLALARRAVVGREDDDGVVQLAQLLERGDQAAHVLVDVVDHRRRRPPCSGRRAPAAVGSSSSQGATSWPSSVLRGGSGVSSAMIPSLDQRARGARRRSSSQPVVVAAPRAGRCRRPWPAAARGPRRGRSSRKNGLVGLRRLEAADHRDRLVGDVVGEVVVVGVLVDLDLGVVLDQPVRMVEVGEAVEDPVEALEARAGTATSACGPRRRGRCPWRGATCRP